MNFCRNLRDPYILYKTRFSGMTPSSEPPPPALPVPPDDGGRSTEAREAIVAKIVEKIRCAATPEERLSAVIQLMEKIG
jgi:hypothetical protein